MTDLDLICEEPYIIGLLGAISFISFSIGSIMLTDIIDTNGRKKVLVLASAVTPIGITCLFFDPNIYVVYGIMFAIGLTYNPRGSVAYLYGAEFLEKKEKLKFGAYNFTLSGVLQFLSAVWFYYLKNQDSYFVIMILMMTASIVWVHFFVPESPVFLYEIQDFERLEKCLLQVARINRVKNYEKKIKGVMDKIKS